MGCCSSFSCYEGNAQITDRKEKTLEKPKSLSIINESNENIQFFQKRTPSVIQESEDFSENTKKTCTINVNYCKCGGRLHFSQSLIILPSAQNQKCEICKRSYFKCFLLCDKCSLLICSFCAKIVGYKFSIVYCPNNHRLCLDLNRVALLFELHNQKYFTCSQCNETKIEPSWTCKTCEFDLCLKCGRFSGLDLPKIELQCFEGHDLKFCVLDASESKSLQCSNCFKAGCKERLACAACEFYYCFSCSISKISNIFKLFQCGLKHKLSVVMLKHMKKIEKWITCLNCSLATLKLAYHCSECCLALCLNCCSELLHMKLKYFSKPCQCSSHREFFLNPWQDTRCATCQDSINSAFFHCFSCKSSNCLICISVL